MDEARSWLERVGSAVGSLVLTSLLVFTGLLILDVGSLYGITQGWFALYSAVTVMSAIEVYGRDVYRAWKGGTD